MLVHVAVVTLFLHIALGPCAAHRGTEADSDHRRRMQGRTRAARTDTWRAPTSPTTLIASTPSHRAGDHHDLEHAVR